MKRNTAELPEGYRKPLRRNRKPVVPKQIKRWIPRDRLSPLRMKNEWIPHRADWCEINGQKLRQDVFFGEVAGRKFIPGQLTGAGCGPCGPRLFDFGGGCGCDGGCDGGGCDGGGCDGGCGGCGGCDSGCDGGCSAGCEGSCGGSWGDSGSYSAGDMNATGDVNAFAGTAYDASTAGTGTGAGGDWGSFGATSYSGFDAPNPSFADIGMYGATTGGGDWGSAGAFSAAGTGGGPGGAMVGDNFGGGLYGESGGGCSMYGDPGGGGLFGGYEGGGCGGCYGGGGGGGKGGGGGGFTGTSSGGGGGKGGSSGGTSGGGKGTSGYTTSVSGGKDVTPSEVSSPYADDTAVSEQEGPEAAPAAEPAAEQFGTPTSEEAGPTETSEEAGPSTATPDEAGGREASPSEAPSTSNFGPQSVAYNEAAQALSDLTQSALSGYDYTGSPYADMGQQQAAPDFNQVFDSVAAAPGWDPGEQTAGVHGLAEPTDWGANPYSAPGALGRDFEQAFTSFDMPTGMDLAGDWTTQAGDVNPNSSFAMGWDPANAYEGRGADYASGRAAQDYVTDLVSAAPAGMAAPGILSALSTMTGISPGALLGGMTTTGGILGGLFGAPGRDPTQSPQQPIDVEIVQAPAPQEVQPQALPEVQVQAPQEEAPQAMPQEAPQTQAPQEAPQEAPQAQQEVQQASPEAPQAQPQEAQQAQPQEAQPQEAQQAQQAQQAPSLIEMAQQIAPTLQVLPAETPSVIDMQPPGAPTQPTQPAPAPEAPFGTGDPDNQADHDTPEPADTSQPPQDPNAPRPPGNIPGQLLGSRGTYQNQQADNPQVNQNYRNSGRTDYPQGRPGIDFRTARQAGIEPRFRTGDINVHDLDARLVAAINRAMEDMPAGIRDTLTASSGYRAAHRGEALEHMMDPRTSQESVYSRGHPSNGRGGFPSARPGNSNHGHGRAIDFNSSPALSWLRANAGRYGLATIPNDHPHIQLQGARGNVGARPSAQEQQEQRAIDAQNRQAAIDRGLIAPGQGQAPAQQAGIPMPQARPVAADLPPGGWRGIGSDRADIPWSAPQPVVTAQPEVTPAPALAEPPAALPSPTMPLPPEPPSRPPAEIPAPAPFLAPPARGRVDPATQVQNALNIIKDSTAKLTTKSGQAEFNAAGVVAAKGLAAAGVPLAMARDLMTKSAYQGAEKVGYGPSAMLWSVYKAAIDSGITAALQGYRAAAPGEVQGPSGFQPDAPVAPGRQGAAPFGQQFAGLAQSLGPTLQEQMSPGGREGDVGAQQSIFSIPALERLSPIIAPPAPPPEQPAASQRGQASLFDFLQNNPTRFLAKGGRVAEDEPVVVGEQGPEYFVPDRPGTVVPHMPQPGKGTNVDRWPKLPAVNYPGRYGGVEREYERQTREAQNPVPSLMDMIDSGQLRLTPNWQRMLTDPSLIELGRSRIEDRREGIDPSAEQYGAFIPASAPAASPPDPVNLMAQALGYGSIRRPMRIGRQNY